MTRFTCWNRLIACGLGLLLGAAPHPLGAQHGTIGEADAAPSVEEFPPYDTGPLGTLLESFRARHGVPALAAAVIRDGKTVAVGVAGVRAAGSAPRVTLEDHFHIGSCTKSMTATLCAILVEEGLLRWDSRVAEVFPQIESSLDPAFREATLEHLLCHRAGLPEDRSPDLVVFPRLLALKGEITLQRRAAIPIIMGRPPASAVGETYSYANLGFAIAGAMCEAATSSSYETLMHKRLFEPLKMRSAGFGPPGSAQQLDQPRGHQGFLGWYVAVRPGPGSDNVPLLAPAGTVHCSLGDWAKYAALHLQAARGEPRLLTADSFAKLHSDPFHQGYGFGWLVTRSEASAGLVLSHDGSNTLWYALIMISPEENLALLVATNAATRAATRACQDTLAELRSRYTQGDASPGAEGAS